ncbi:general stress protein [Microcella humidisoli]|uniref:General stress protein 17M-like domain-containing protein n=1 Tax=Microcella humidisoli TaxID=2963406 RepID=A0ABY5FUW1_9MICO|nr:general stress protein [Microcella humidisoli]UTT61727.1 hypothetical protein NNL39_08545 [Microcella humidisoli]
MSNSSPFARRSSASLTVPRGDVLGEYETYPEAQKVVDRLAKAEFPVKGIAIVGSDLKTVERITGRLSYGRAALSGAASGAWLGLFFGMLLFLFSPEPQLSFILAAAFIGSGFGMIFGITTYAINRRRRDFGSTHQVLASSYQIIIDPSQTARARQALAGGSTWPPPLPETAPSDAPTSAARPLDAPPAGGTEADADSAAGPAADESATKR